jgi:2-iminobutanoate/2-iminopropanoate deaminase
MSVSKREVVLVTAIAGIFGWLLFIQAQKKKKKSLALISTSKAAPAGGHYSQAIVHNDLVYVSGILPVSPSGEKLNKDCFELQAAMVLSNLKSILTASGSSFQNVISVRVYIVDIEQWGEFNKLYTKAMGSHKPARAVVPVPCLHHGFALEVEAIAAVPT